MPALDRKPSPVIAIVAVVLGFCLAIGLDYGYTTWAVQSQIRNSRQQGLEVQKKICTTLSLLYADQPPVGSFARNSSRAYLQDLHARFGDLKEDLGC